MSQLHVLDHRLWFPSVEDALEDGLLAIGGDMHINRLLLAYKTGIFPWYEGDVPLWWSPDPRFVLFPDNLKVSKSMKTIIKRNIFRFTVNTAFEQVITHCKNVVRREQDGTWITPEIVHSFVQLHHEGHAVSAEAWMGDELVGGLYGIRIGNVFFGESMFSRQNNASKFAFICFVEYLKQLEVKLIDCQVYTNHLESLGAIMIDRKEFMKMLREWT